MRRPSCPLRVADNVEFLLVEVLLQEVDRIGIVIDDQDAFFGGTRFGALSGILNRSRLTDPQSRGVEASADGEGFTSILHWNGEGESRAFAQFAFDS